MRNKYKQQSQYINNTEDIIFEVIKKNSPFKQYGQSSSIGQLSSLSDIKKSNAKKGSDNVQQQLLPIESKIESKISRQKSRRVTFIQVNKDDNKINPQLTRRLQENKQYKKHFQYQKYNNKQKQTQIINQSLQQLKKNVDQLIGSIGLKSTNNYYRTGQMLQQTPINNQYKIINLSNSNKNKYSQQNNQLTERKHSLFNLDSNNINDSSSRVIINKDKSSGIDRLKVYRHIEDAKKQFKDVIGSSGSGIIGQSNIFQTQTVIGKRSHSVKQPLYYDLHESTNKPRPNVIRRDDNIFTPVRSSSQRIIRTKSHDNKNKRQLSLINKQQQQKPIIRSNSQLVINNNQHKKLNTQLHKLNNQAKQLKNLLNFTNSSLTLEQTQYHKQQHNRNISNNNFIANSNTKSSISRYRNKWNHQNQMEMLRFKLLGK